MKQTIVLFFLFLFAISCQEEIEPNFSFTNEQEEITRVSSSLYQF